MSTRKSLCIYSLMLHRWDGYLSKEEWLAIVEAVQHFAHKHGHPKCNKDDKEFFDVLIAKVTLLRYLDTDNTLQIPPKQEELS